MMTHCRLANIKYLAELQNPVSILLQHLQNLHTQGIAGRFTQGSNSAGIGGRSRLAVKMAEIVHGAGL